MVRAACRSPEWTVLTWKPDAWSGESKSAWPGRILAVGMLPCGACLPRLTVDELLFVGCVRQASFHIQPEQRPRVTLGCDAWGGRPNGHARGHVTLAPARPPITATRGRRPAPSTRSSIGALRWPRRHHPPDRRQTTNASSRRVASPRIRIPDEYLEARPAAVTHSANGLNISPATLNQPPITPSGSVPPASSSNAHIRDDVPAEATIPTPIPNPLTMAASAESLLDLHESSLSDDRDDVDSLPSTSTSDIYSDADSEAQAEWDRSLEQLQLILTMMIVPWMGKYFGRKFAFWSKPRPLSRSRVWAPRRATGTVTRG